jgi:dUTP pyrophosphatase
MHGTIDPSYRGALSVFVFNPNTYNVLINKGDYLAQLVLIPAYVPPLVVVDKLSPTQRGERGFGSSDLISSVNDRK